MRELQKWVACAKLAVTIMARDNQAIHFGCRRQKFTVPCWLDAQYRCIWPSFRNTAIQASTFTKVLARSRPSRPITFRDWDHDGLDVLSSHHFLECG